MPISDKIMGFFRRKSKLVSLIEQGEHQQQDFKYAITDSKKIARSLAAFANTDGGRLLLGVKDNGSIVGVKTEEEYYMIEAAAQMYCKPQVAFTVQKWKEKGNTVLEIIVEKSKEELHAAPNNNGKYMVYTRVADQNLLVNKIYIDAFNKRKRDGLVLRISKPVELLVQYLNEHEKITFAAYCRKFHLKRDTAHRILSHLAALNIIHIQFTEKSVFYALNKDAIQEYDDFKEMVL